MRKTFPILFSFLLLAAIPACAKKFDTGFLDRTLAIQGTSYKYQVFVPDNWSPSKKWPIILAPKDLRDTPPSSLNPYEDTARKVGGATPVWIFHGAADDTIPVAESQRMAAAMKALGGEVHYTEYPGAGHGPGTKPTPSLIS